MIATLCLVMNDLVHLCLYLMQKCNIFDGIEQRSECECGPQSFIVHTFKKRQSRNL